jgi:predicted house-cleaning noncanonical NTP pyrophosphatase (MazG superfamily)
MGKLVRNLVPQIIAAEGRTPKVRVLKAHEYESALLDKLSEEVAELCDAAPHHRLCEAADVYEVLLSILALKGLDADDLADSATEKRRTRGGFTEHWWWDAD